jgi:hypothetical protein
MKANSFIEHALIEYDGPLKPCAKCGSKNVKYLRMGTGKRLACFYCNVWLKEVEDLNEEEQLDAIRSN